MAGFSYFPHTDDDIRVMLERVGVRSLDDLYSDVPADFIYKGEYDLPAAMSEQEVRDFFEGLGKKNTQLKVFVGQGAYDHYVPSVIPYITSRSEFLTAYTPYQCEISQGTLRYIFEWQSMICRLTGMDVANASMYDGPSAAAEALRMTVACTRKRNKVVVSTKLMQNVLDVVASYLKYPEIEVVYAWDVLEALGPDVAGVIVPSICRHGVIQDLTGIADAVPNEIKRFFDRHLCQYDYQDYPVCFVGSVATRYSEILLQVAYSYDVNVKKIVSESMPGLVVYHSVGNKA